LKYIWRKRAGARWLRVHGEDIARRFGGALALVERPGSERVLLEISCPTGKRAKELIQEFGGKAEKLRPDWLQRFVKQGRFKPLRIGSRLVILGAPARQSVAAQTLVIPAEAAFGTGHHATTAMCLRLLEQVTRRVAPGWRMLDAGTGSGILAIAGDFFGAKRVLAIENDPLACAAAKRNARANGARHLEITAGDILKQRLTGKCDIITANLFSDLLIATLPRLSRSLAAGGFLILSGILRSQEKAVVTALRRNGCVLQEIRRRGKWIALLAVPLRKRA
jgi:ribosomal protein L11 methyltransferase